MSTGKKAKSQWDFGELFPETETRRVWTVTQLTGRVRQLIESQIGAVWVSGEVSNLRTQASGHSYFTLKDAAAQLNCVLFRSAGVRMRELLEDGAKVLLYGELTVYEPRGQYQLRVEQVELQGVGALQLAFERLKRKLEAEGLFAAERKRSVPPHPRRIGLVTSPTGAALRDVLHVAGRRNPALEFVLAPARVQGDGAAEEIASAICLLNDWSAAAGPAERLDAILITRGGGSLEDLWAFNEEIVARAVAASALPTVSAVGHEIDLTICDFAADLRAATPSAAAEVLTAGAVRAAATLDDAARRLGDLARRRLRLDLGEVRRLAARLARAHPRRRLEVRWQRLDELSERMARGAGSRRTRAAERLRLVLGGWRRVRPAALIQQRRDRLASLADGLTALPEARCQALRHRLEHAAARLRLLSPDNVLARGYSITTDDVTGTVVRAPDDVRRGQVIRTRVRQGTFRSIVN